MRFFYVLPLALAIPTTFSTPLNPITNTNLTTTTVPTIVCDQRNIAPHSDCVALIKILSSSPSFDTVQKSPREIRHHACFVSWHREWSGTKVTLARYAQYIVDSCSDKIAISGAGRVDGMRFCVSSRGKYC